MSTYTDIQSTKKSFEEVENKIREKLAEQGFGIITEINVQDTLRKKLGVESSKYKILGACNPKFAHKALTIEPEIGALLPCNVILFEEKGFAKFGYMKPTVILQLSDRSELEEIAQEIEARLKNVLTEVSELLKEKVES